MKEKKKNNGPFIHDGNIIRIEIKKTYSIVKDSEDAIYGWRNGDIIRWVDPDFRLVR